MREVEFMMNEQEIEKCPECSSSHLEEDYLRGEMVCTACGLVVSDRMIDIRQEWSANTGNIESGFGASTPTSQMLFDKGLSTDISWKDVDSLGNRIPSSSRSSLHRIRKWHKRLRAINTRERNLLVALTVVERMCSNLKLPNDVREESCAIYRKALVADLVKGRSIEGMVASSIYISSRYLGFPRSIDEVAKISGVGRKEVGRNARIMLRVLKIPLQPTNPVDFVSRFCSELNLVTDVEKKALEILSSINEAPEKVNTFATGKEPTGIAAAAIYIAGLLCGKKITQCEIANTAGITEVTLRNRFKDIINIPNSALVSVFPDENKPPYQKIHAATFDSYLRKTTLGAAQSAPEGQS